MCGFDASQIAALANVPVEAVVPMVRVALAKLDQGLAIEDRARVDGPDQATRGR